MKTQISFESLPLAVNQLLIKMEVIEKLLQVKNGAQLTTVESDEFLTIKEASSLLHLSVPTLYSLVSKGLIPNYKKQKRLYFSKNELYNYIKEGRRKSIYEIETEAHNYLKKNN